MSKKDKSNKNETSKKKSLKLILIICAALILCGAAIFGIVKGISAAKAKILDVAFYNLPEHVIAPLQEKISAEYEEKVNFVVLTEDQYDVNTIAKKYDLFFAWNGSAVNQLADKAKKISGEAYSYIVPSLVPDNLKYLPLSLDHWEMAYYKRGMEKTTTGYPRSLENLDSLLNEMKEIVFVPMYLSGGNDNELLAFISAVTESIGGSNAYANLVKKLAETEDLEGILDYELDSESKVTLRTILDKIIEWQKEELLYTKWTSSKDGELINLGNERQIGVFFTSLTKHRTFPLSVTEGYAADRFPLVNSKESHGLIGNSVVCMKLTDSSAYDKILLSFVQPDYQYSLSKATKYGPVGLTAQSYDRQADDVRYLAAVSELGVVPDLSKAAFQTNPQKKSDFASQLRIYLKKNL